MIIFSEMIEDIGGHYTRLLLASMQPAPAIKLILPSAARLGTRGAAFYLVQRPHLPPLSSKLSFVRSFSLYPNSPPTRIPRFVKAYAHIFHFDFLISFVFRTCTCISAYIHEYVKYDYLKSSKRIKGYELLLLNGRSKRRD